MALERQPGVLGAHAAAVVGDGDPVAPAGADLDAHAPGAGVEGVLDQLLHHGGRPLDDLAGRDLVDQGVGSGRTARRGGPGFEF